MPLHLVRCYAAPRYPTEEIVRENPAFLTVLPSRWRGNRLALGALAGVLALSLQGRVLAEPAGVEKTETLVVSGSFFRVAPLFVHGKGRGDA